MKFHLPLTCVVLTLLITLTKSDKVWWENGNLYQIYPRSFKDTDGDGIGDLNGITENLEYLRDLGMDGVWLSPIFRSPMADFGYDISDYTQIQQEYGNVDDMVTLIDRAHELGLKVILDFVPNHTSDEHEWFQRSISGEPEYRDFYIWHDGIVNSTTGERHPPSNWLSSLYGGAWEWNDVRQQYYLHQFTVKQPDLNYRNPAVQEALKNVLRYWLSKGIDGFRIDAVPYFYESDIDPETGTYPDEPVNEDNTGECIDPTAWCHYNHIYTKDLPEDIEVIYDWRDLLDAWQRDYNTDSKILLTEAYTSFSNLMLMYGNGKRNGSNVPFNFEMLNDINNKSTASDYNYYINHWLSSMPAGVLANWVLGNHDNGRVATRLGPQRTDLINILLQTLPGIAVTYNGEELGMQSVEISWEDTVDPYGCSGTPETYQQTSRDPERTPFRWDASKNAGFSTANQTWLVVGDGYETTNVAFELAASNSHLKIFKRLINLRKTEPAFQGNFESAVVGDVLLYKRQAESGDTFIIVLNIGDKDELVSLNSKFSDIDILAKVEVASLQSALQNGQIVSTLLFPSKAYEGYVLRVISIGQAVNELIDNIFSRN